MKQNIRRTLALAAALALLLGLLAGCSPKAEAATMHLKRTEGTVGVSDGEGKDLEPAENLGLFSGYGVDTKSASYAWIDLDEVKLTKMDENSQVEIKKEDKHLTIDVKSGNLFFNVTKPLAEDETMDIRTSTMVVGIRGTCGWVTQDTAALLEGRVEVTAGESTAAVHAGEMAVLTEDGKLEVKPFTAEAVPAFVWVEVEKDDTLTGAIPETTPEPEESEPPEAPADPMRLRDMYTYSKVLSYSNGELDQEMEYFPDEQGRIGRAVTHFATGNELITEYIYNDAGTLQAMSAENGATYTVTEDTADHRTMEWIRDFDGGHMKYIYYYDEQGRETRYDHFFNGEFIFYDTFTYDLEGRLIRSDRYLADGSANGIYFLYEYD